MDSDKVWYYSKLAALFLFDITLMFSVVATAALFGMLAGELSPMVGLLVVIFFFMTGWVCKHAVVGFLFDKLFGIEKK
jgi:hypothetical protein